MRALVIAKYQLGNIRFRDHSAPTTSHYRPIQELRIIELELIEIVDETPLGSNQTDCTSLPANAPTFELSQRVVPHTRFLSVPTSGRCSDKSYQLKEVSSDLMRPSTFHHGREDARFHHLGNEIGSLA